MRRIWVRRYSVSKRIESKNAAVLSANSEPLAPASALDADLLEEHDVNNGSSRSDTLQSVRYQPRESQILILLIIIAQTICLLTKIVLIFTINKEKALKKRCNSATFARHAG